MRCALNENYLQVSVLILSLLKLETQGEDSTRHASPPDEVDVWRVRNLVEVPLHLHLAVYVRCLSYMAI